MLFPHLSPSAAYRLNSHSKDPFTVHFESDLTRIKFLRLASNYPKVEFTNFFWSALDVALDARLFVSER